MHEQERVEAVLTLVLTSEADAPHRVVRIASATPFDLISLRLGAPRAGRRRMRVTVATDRQGAETLCRRLDRVVDVVSVRLVG
jgi:acetolactate synthase regulatory subunit